VSEEPAGDGTDGAAGSPPRLDPDRAAGSPPRLDPDRAGGSPPRLDPDQAAETARRAARHAPPQVVDTRRYQRAIGFFGLLLVIIISVSFLTSRGTGTAGVPAGRQLPLFAAPLALSSLNGAVNLHPPCTASQHEPGALNVCLLVKHGPLVLAFFVTSSSGCERIVDSMQSVARTTSSRGTQFAAVAVRTSHADARRAVRAHGWTIPVAYDVDGRLGAAYGIEVCPIVELAERGGRVTRRLIGEHWNSSAALAAQVRSLSEASAR
jgi:AhpC/TSA family